jgi:hypothetical protein
VGGRAQTWYAEAKLEEGAAATFLGLIFREVPVLGLKSWQALAVGDSCLFQVRHGRLITSFPMTRSTDFGSTPTLVSSYGADRMSDRNCRTGTWRDQDCFWLMTDALAQWFLREHEHGHQPQVELEPFLEMGRDEGAARFAEWIVQRRQARDMRNDDVTLIGIVASG